MKKNHRQRGQRTDGRTDLVLAGDGLELRERLRLGLGGLERHRRLEADVLGHGRVRQLLQRAEACLFCGGGGGGPWSWCVALRVVSGEKGEKGRRRESVLRSSIHTHTSPPTPKPIARQSIHTPINKQTPKRPKRTDGLEHDLLVLRRGTQVPVLKLVARRKHRRADGGGQAGGGGLRVGGFGFWGSWGMR